MLVGRERELAQLDRLLDEARGGSSTLTLVEGPPGIGKTSLLDAFIHRHRDLQVRSASGATWEADHRWGVLEQLTDAPVAGADAVDVAHRFLDVIREPTIIVVDDAHWADPESLQALSSMIRRAHAHSILMVWLVPDVLPDEVTDATVRTLRSHGADTIHLGPLGPADIAQLAIVRIGADLASWTAQRLHEHTLGSPRAVVQLLDEIPRVQWQRWQDRFPATKQHAAAVRRALAGCAPQTRALVEAVAILGSGTSLAPAADLADIDNPTPPLDEAHDVGLLTTHERRGVVTVSFPDPMTSAAVSDDIGPARWHELHLRAAGIVDDEGASLFHQVSATPTADGILADRLDRYARQRATDGAWLQAAEALITASRITPERELRTSRLIRGVDALTGAADLPRAQTYVAEIESVPGGPMRNAVLGYLAIQRGRAAEAHQLLSEAWTLLGDNNSEPEHAAMIAHRMVLHSLARLRGEDLVEWADRAASLVPEGTPAAVEASAIRGLGLGMTGKIVEARSFYAELSDHVRLGAQSQRIRMAEGWLALALDEPDRARSELESAEPTTFRGGSLRISLWAQAWLARTQIALGAWNDAKRTVDRAAAQLDSTDLDLLRPLVHWTGAQVHALQGNWPAAVEHLHRGRSGPNDYALMLVPSCIAAAQCAEVAADYEGVLRQLQPLVALRHRSALDEPGFWPWADLYGNALVMTGRVDEADLFLRPHEERAAERQHRSARAGLGYVRGRIHGARGDIDSARASFESALDAIAPLPLPYERARINFAYGQTLRRAGRRREADAVMRSARELYSALGATSYVERCNRELQAGGLKSTESGDVRGDASMSALTPQERAVATLVASGRTNKEVAGELFVSVKTVQYHLTRVYAKFGIRSRSELAAHFRHEE
ncbi:MAG: AAA family ATPase [Rhodococcus sp. (in: high G+C Gram-positive bacteria)]|uniref:helix-turn-helix transcriptional regulator n=1 Tax=Rhodococcus sp. TaxID=1831 RepID=UPI003BB665C3